MKDTMQDFAPLFDEIQKVVAAFSSSEVSSPATTDHSDHSRALEMFRSQSLWEHETESPVAEVRSRLRREVFPPLPKWPPQAQASGLAEFCSQYKEVCELYASSLAVLEATRPFFESKDDTLSSLKRMDDAQRKMKTRIEGVDKEIERLEGQLRKLKETESRLLQEYAAIGRKCERLKPEWDEIAAKMPEMIEKREKAEKELAEIEAKWNNFIRMFMCLRA